MDATAPTLRPLGVGDIVDRTIGLYRASPGPFLVLAALPYLVLAIVSLILNQVFVRVSQVVANPFPVGAARSVDLQRSFPPEVLAEIGQFYVVLGIVGLIVLSVQAAALVDAMSKRYLGQPMTLGGSLRAGLRASVRLILASIAAFLAFIVVFVIAIVALAILAAALNNPLPVVVGVIGLLVLIFYVIASFLPLPAVVTLEARRPISALGRAWRLANGARWRILGLLSLMAIMQGILGILFAVLLLGTVATDGAARTVLQEVANLAVNALWAPIQWGVFTILYYDLRVRKEAFDLQLAAEALPRDT